MYSYQMVQFPMIMSDPNYSKPSHFQYLDLVMLLLTVGGATDRHEVLHLIN